MILKLIEFSSYRFYLMNYDRQLAIRKPIIMTKANIKGPLFIFQN